MPSAAPVVLPDSFDLYGSQQLAVTSQQGVLANDTGDGGAFLSVMAVNGQATDVGNPITLASGALLQLEADGSFVYTPATGFFGPDVFDYTASDGENSATASVTITSVEITLDAIADQTNVESDSVALQIHATVSHGPPLAFNYGADNLPAGLNIDSTTGLISGTLAYGSAGTTPVVVWAQSPDTTAMTYREFTWTIAPVEITLAQIADQTNVESDSVSLQVSASVSHGPPLDYYYIADNLPAGLSIDSTTGLISGTIDSGTAGTVMSSVSVQATNTTATAYQAFEWVITPAPITIEEIADQQQNEGDTVSLAAIATLPEGGAVTFSANNLPLGVSIDPLTGMMTGTLAANSAGTYTVTVYADSANSWGDQQFTWEVASRITLAPVLDRVDVQGNSVTVQLSATSLDSAPLTFTATDLPDGLTLNAETGLISGTLSPEAFSAEVTVVVSDGTYTSSGTFVWQVDSPIHFAEIPSLNLTEGDSVAVALDATSPGNEPLVYSAIGLPSGLSLDPATGLIAGSLASGSAVDVPYLIEVQATDGTYTGSARFTLAVQSRVMIEAIGDQIVPEGAVVSLPIHATTSGLDPLTYSVDSLPAGLSLDTETGLITGVLANGSATGDNPFNVTITVSEGIYYSQTTTIRWIINSRAVAGDLVGESDTYFIGTNGWLDASGEPDTDATLLANDSSTAPLTITAVNGLSYAVGETITLASGATLWVNAQGQFTYQAAEGIAADDSFFYTVTDGIASVVVPVFINLQAPQPATGILEVLKANILRNSTGGQNWGTAGTERITEAEFNALVANPNITDRAQVATLATLKANYLTLKKLFNPEELFQNGIGKDEIAAYEKIRAGINGPPIFGPLAKYVPFVRLMEEDYQGKLAAYDANQKVQYLITGEQPPQGAMTRTFKFSEIRTQLVPSAILQGLAGDCTFLSGVIGAIKTGATVREKEPFIIEKNYDPATKGQWAYKVTFAGRKATESIEAPTQAEMLLYASAGKNGLWLAVIEKAYAQAYAADVAANRGPLGVFLYGKPEDSYNAINGARSTVGVELLTGNPSRTLSVGFNQPLKTTELDAVLRGAVVNPTGGMQPLKVVAVGGSRANPDWANLPLNLKLLGLIPGHAYTITGYNPSNGKIQLQNPWGNHNWAKGTVFEENLVDFVQLFDTFSIEIIKKTP